MIRIEQARAFLEIVFAATILAAAAADTTTTITATSFALCLLLLGSFQSLALRSTQFLFSVILFGSILGVVILMCQ